MYFQVSPPRNIARCLWVTVILSCMLLAALSLPQAADAHGYIIRSIPENGAVLAQAPSRIQIWFTENLEARFSTLTVSDQHGQDVTLTDVGLAPTNAAQLTAKLPSSLPN